MSYFEKDSKYDKGYYLMNWHTLVTVTLALIAYYGYHILVFWGHVCLATTHVEEAMWLCVALFIFANVWIFVMVIAGHFTNRRLAQYEFYLEKINDKEQENRENAAREEQKRKQAAKQRGETHA